MGPLSLIFVGRHALECPAMPCNSKVYIDNSCNSRVPVWKKTHNLHGNANRMILLFHAISIFKSDAYMAPISGVIIWPTQAMHYYKGNPSKLPSMCLFWSPKNLCNSMTRGILQSKNYHLDKSHTIHLSPREKPRLVKDVILGVQVQQQMRHIFQLPVILQTSVIQGTKGMNLQNFELGFSQQKPWWVWNLQSNPWFHKGIPSNWDFLKDWHYLPKKKNCFWMYSICILCKNGCL